MSELKSGSNLEKVLKAGHFAFTGECGPPKGANVEHLKEKFKYLKGNVDCVNLTDNQTAVVRMSSLAASSLMVAEGLEPNFQMVCRDRNRLAIMSDILGAHALGIRNMLCLSGDHQSFGNHPQAKNVHDIDSMLTKRWANRRSRIGLPSRNLQFNLRHHFLSHNFPQLTLKVFQTAQLNGFAKRPRLLKTRL